ncbi:uncharacterized protein LOC62_02G001909 [Vanrija pseudolonga]|uniref:Ada DNA repair metal-binding domain-containing protein n=1 Tax=Vanrija pseudolonga TaxID=143232 RepID=A0AAF0Y2U0_9TREE|nr:hypothetical protein LOC62_02G001909 [Vanrija pseudolonga]
MPKKSYTLLSPTGPYQSPIPGTLGGHRRLKLFGRLDCPSALRALARGGYKTPRVFFLHEGDAWGAGYRPCGVCMRDKYLVWKAAQAERGGSLPARSKPSATRRRGASALEVVGTAATTLKVA